MSDQPSLFDQAREQRDRALHLVEENSDEEWRAEALEAIYRTAEELPLFIVDDVWASGLSSTREDRALGPMMKKAAGMGWISKTDRTRPSVRSHLSPKPVWQSHIAIGGTQ